MGVYQGTKIKYHTKERSAQSHTSLSLLTDITVEKRSHIPESNHKPLRKARLEKIVTEKLIRYPIFWDILMLHIHSDHSNTSHLSLRPSEVEVFYSVIWNYTEMPPIGLV